MAEHNEIKITGKLIYNISWFGEGHLFNKGVILTLKHEYMQFIIQARVFSDLLEKNITLINNLKKGDDITLIGSIEDAEIEKIEKTCPIGYKTKEYWMVLYLRLKELIDSRFDF